MLLYSWGCTVVSTIFQFSLSQGCPSSFLFLVTQQWCFSCSVVANGYAPFAVQSLRCSLYVAMRRYPREDGTQAKKLCGVRKLV